MRKIFRRFFKIKNPPNYKNKMREIKVVYSFL